MPNIFSMNCFLYNKFYCSFNIMEIFICIVENLENINKPQKRENNLLFHHPDNTLKCQFL